MKYTALRKYLRLNSIGHENDIISGIDARQLELIEDWDDLVDEVTDMLVHDIGMGIEKAMEYSIPITDHIIDFNQVKNEKQSEN